MLYSKFSLVVFSSHVFLFIVFPFMNAQPAQTTADVNDDLTACIVPAMKLPGTGFNKVQLNRNAVHFVADYIKKNNEELVKIKERSDSPFKTMDGIFSTLGLPIELKYLAVIESELKATAVSRVGAVGPWQLMPATARILGLKITKRYDERKQYTKSTKAAALYLRDLYRQFGDWLLVMAAYNCGPGPVYAAIHKSGSRNFWNLQAFLPGESRQHVKKFIATHYYFEGQGSVTTLTKAENIKYSKLLLAEQVKQQLILTEKDYFDVHTQTGIEKSIASRN